MKSWCSLIGSDCAVDEETGFCVFILLKLHASFDYEENDRLSMFIILPAVLFTGRPEL
jgi:hypothetical protein